MHATDP
jgi:hypothetical protein